MPLLTIPGSQAVQNLRANRYARWPRREDIENRVEPKCHPGFEPSFRIELGDKIFAIGSCFARHIETALAARGFDVATLDIPKADPSFVGSGDRSILNNYGLPSILNELRWALDASSAYDPRQNILEVSPGRFTELHLASLPGPYDTMTKRRHCVTSIVRRVVECRIVVITLGLSEVWFDRETGSYLNHTPPRSIVVRHAERFELHVLSFDESVGFLRQVVALLRTHCRADQRILLTVSPVPLAATHRTCDVVVANCYSKSVLRSTAEVIALENSNMDYFPSYESIVSSDRQAAWEDDLTHVRRPMIDLNVERMISAYCAMPDAIHDKDIGLRLSAAKEYLDMRDFLGAIRQLEPIRDAVTREVELAMLYTEICIHLHRIDAARTSLQYVPPDRAGWRRLRLDALLLAKSGDIPGAIATLRRLAEAQSDWTIWQALARVCQDAGLWDDAIAALHHWLKMAPRSAEPLRLVARIHRLRGAIEQADLAYRVGIERDFGSNGTIFDYIDFLIECGRTVEAAQLLPRVAPTNLSQIQRADELRALLPAASVTQNAESGEHETGNDDVLPLFDNSSALARAREQKAENEEAVRSLKAAEVARQASDWPAVISLTNPFLGGRHRKRALPLHAMALHWEGRYEEAEQEYRELTAAYPDAPELHVELSETINARAREETIRLLQHARTLNPAKFRHWYRLGSLLLAAGRSRDAADVVTEGIAANPNNVRLATLKKTLAAQERNRAFAPIESTR